MNQTDSALLQANLYFQMSQAARKYNGMSVSQRETDAGKALYNELKKLNEQVLSLSQSK